MAKLAVLFLFFALFAVCFAARIAREEPKSDIANKIGDDVKNFVDLISKALSPENVKAFEEKIKTITDDISNKLTEKHEKA